MLTVKQKEAAKRVFNEITTMSRGEFKEALDKHGDTAEVKKICEFLAPGEHLIFGYLPGCDRLPSDNFKDAVNERCIIDALSGSQSGPWGRGSDIVLDGKRYNTPCPKTAKKMQSKEDDFVRENPSYVETTCMSIDQLISIWRLTEILDEIEQAKVGTVNYEDAYLFLNFRGFGDLCAV